MGRSIGRPQAVRGSLAPFAAGYREQSDCRGLFAGRVRLRLWQLDRISRWLDGEGLAASELTPAVVERFLAARRAAGYRTWLSPRSMVLPVGYLRAVGAVPGVAPVVRDGPVEELLAGFRRYLLIERGLAASTVGDYQRIARLFLVLTTAGDIALERLSAREVTGFLARECPARSVPSAKILVCGLRSLLRYLHLVGVTSVSLASAVPGVAAPGERLPRGCSRRWWRGCWPAVIGGAPSGGAITRSCCCSPGLGCGPGRSPPCAWRTWTGGPESFWFAARAIVANGSRCRPTSAPRSSPICSIAADRRYASCSCASTHHMARCVPARFGRWCTTRACAPGSNRSARTGCGTRPRPRCCGPVRRCPRSPRCFATAGSRRPRSTPKSTGRRCASWRQRGREARHDRSRSRPG